MQNVCDLLIWLFRDAWYMLRHDHSVLRGSLRAPGVLCSIFILYVIMALQACKLVPIIGHLSGKFEVLTGNAESDRTCLLGSSVMK